MSAILDVNAVLVLRSECFETVDPSSADEKMHAASDDEAMAAWRQVVTSTPLLCDIVFSSSSAVDHTTYDPSASRRQLLGLDDSRSIIQFPDEQLNPCGGDNILLLTTELATDASLQHFQLGLTDCRMNVTGSSPIDRWIVPVRASPSIYEWKTTSWTDDTEATQLQVNFDVTTAKRFFLEEWEKHHTVHVPVAIDDGNLLAAPPRDLPPKLASNPVYDDAATSNHGKNQSKIGCELLLKSLEIMLEKELQDINHILGAMGAVAVVLVAACGWTAMRMGGKNKTNRGSAKEHGSMQQELSVQAVVLERDNNNKTPVEMSPVSLDRPLAQTTSNLSARPDHSSSNTLQQQQQQDDDDLSPCSKLELEWSKARQSRRRQSQDDSKKQKKKILQPIQSDDELVFLPKKQQQQQQSVQSPARPRIISFYQEEDDDENDENDPPALAGPNNMIAMKKESTDRSSFIQSYWG